MTLIAYSILVWAKWISLSVSEEETLSRKYEMLPIDSWGKQMRLDVSTPGPQPAMFTFLTGLSELEKMREVHSSKI